MNKDIVNLTMVEETIKLPVYSTIKKINGRFIYELDRFEDLPVDWLEHLSKKTKNN